MLQSGVPLPCLDRPGLGTVPSLAVDKYIAMAKEKHGYNIEQVSLAPVGTWGWGWDSAGAV